MRQRVVFACIFSALSLLATPFATRSGAATLSAAAVPIVVTDDAGAKITLTATPTRKDSQTPGATEMLFAAGAGKHIIATVQYSDEPPAAKQVPRIGDVVAIDMDFLVALWSVVVVV